jgi:hypothetical protein
MAMSSFNTAACVAGAAESSPYDPSILTAETAELIVCLQAATQSHPFHNFEGFICRKTDQGTAADYEERRK